MMSNVDASSPSVSPYVVSQPPRVQVSVKSLAEDSSR